MRAPILLRPLVAALMFTLLPTCNRDPADDETAAASLYGFLAGRYSVEVTPGISNCDGLDAAPRETWMVTALPESLSVAPTP